MTQAQQTLLSSLLLNKSPLEFLTEFQKENGDAWLQQSWPTRKTEAWKYTPLKALEGAEFSSSNEIANESLSAEEKQILNIDNFLSFDLVFVDGEYSESLSTAMDKLPEGLEICRFARADSEQKKMIAQYVGSVAKREQHLFVALNNSQMQDGIFLKVHKNAVVDTPVRIVWLTRQQQKAQALAQRLLLVVEENAQATVMEQFISSEEQQNCFTHGVSELLLQENARLYHYRLHQEQEDVSLVSGVHAKLLRSATLESFYLAFGSTLKRLDVVVDHQGEGAHCEMNGVYLPRNKQHIDFHTCIEHAVPHCTTNEVFRGIIGDSAKAVFNGRIHIHKDAQKTLAQLSNKNLLTSKKAEVDTKPELEIYADDVQCAHGATVAQLEESALHYLRTRGVSTEEAKVMLSFGFINALVDKAHHSAIAEYLRPILAKAFAKDPDLMKHIA